MKKVLFIIVPSLIIFFNANSQKRFWEVGILLGGSNYVGDINNMFVNGTDYSKEWNQFESCFNFYNLNAVGGFVARYNFNPRWSFRGSILFSRLNGEDKHFGNTRNLNFFSNIQEFAGTIEFNFLDYRTGSLKHRVTPYLFGGVALFHFNPKTKIKNFSSKETVVVNLHDMHTEGQTFYKGKDNYNLWQISIPFGLGMKFSLNKYICVGIEWGFRRTFTDYIDDISSQYVGRNNMIYHVNQNAAIASDRTNELPDNINVYHKEGEMRGNQTTKDWYNFFGLTITSRIASGNKKCLRN
ncbi:MAG: DUF6089 family protein [Bacteroidales bacterium]